MTSGERSPCAACLQRCCHDYTVIVSGYDAWQIAVRLQMAMEEFLVCVPAQGDAADGFRLESGGRALNIALAKREAGEQAGSCTFWMPLPAGYGRCGIYAIRPFVCQTYPAFLSDGFVQLSPGALCPPGGWNVANMDLPVWRGRLEQYRLESERYCQIVTEWNVRVEAMASKYPPQAYYAYLMAAYSRPAPGAQPDAESSS
jgi:Fe-S-cluster containining protein